MTALTRVNHAYGTSAPSGLTVASAAFNLTAGNHVFVYVRWGTVTRGIVVTDTALNTYTPLAVQFLTNVGGQWFHCLNATGHATNVVTATFDGVATNKDVTAIQITGTAPASITQSVATGTVLPVSIPYTGAETSIGTDSMVLAGESTSTTENPRTFTTNLETWSNLSGITSLLSQVGYIELAAGLARPAVEFTGNVLTANALVSLLALDSEVSPSTPATVDASKTLAYTVGGGSADTVSVSKITAKTIEGGHAERVAVSKISGLVIEGGHAERVGVSKIVAYAVVTGGGSSVGGDAQVFFSS